ncbi:DUF2182 domain-containing protein [Roseobacteraceae bacterium NS-SX3]
MPARTGAAENLARHDRLVVLGAAGVILLLSALYTVLGAGMEMSAAEMTRMARAPGQPMEMGPGPEWTAGYAALIFFMWWIMMIAMMTPSAAPVLLLFTAVKKAGADAGRAPGLSLLFLLGYLLAWAVFSALATALQWALESAGLSNGAMMALSSRTLAGGVLIAAGVYQFTGLKRACLQHCQAPVQFLTAHNRKGPLGALAMGAHHGVYCLGCCWALMLLLFAGGIMNLYWIAGLALFVLAEKHLPFRRAVPAAAGGLLILSGAYLLATG